MTRVIIFGVAVATLIGAGFASAADRTIVLRPVGTHVSQARLDRSVKIMRTRLDRLGAHGSITHHTGSQQIVIRLQGLSRAAALDKAKLISKPARLAFYDLERSLLRPSIDRQKHVVATTSLTQLTVPPRAIVVRCDARTAMVCPGSTSPPQRGVTYYYLFKQPPAMSGKDLVAKDTRHDFDPVTGAPIVTIRFTPHGQKVFREITRAEAHRGRMLGTPQHFAVVLDDQLFTWPQIDYTAYPNGFGAGPGVQITGLASTAEARNVALVLQTGALPVAFTATFR